LSELLALFLSFLLESLELFLVLTGEHSGLEIGVLGLHLQLSSKLVIELLLTVRKVF